VLATAAVIVAFVGGGALATSLASERTSRITMAGEAGEVAESTVGSTAGHTTLAVEVADGVAPTSPNQGGEPPATGGEPPATGGDQTATGGVGSSQGEATGPSSTDSTPQTTPTTSPGGGSTSVAGTGTSQTTTSTSTSPGAGESLVRSDCGDIVVGVQASSVTLVDVDPDPGYQTDVKSSGPSKVEVGFEGPGGHCEVSARVEDGRLVTVVDDDGDDERDDERADD
jgi:hypothetical protein